MQRRLPGVVLLCAFGAAAAYAQEPGTAAESAPAPAEAAAPPAESTPPPTEAPPAPAQNVVTVPVPVPDEEGATHFEEVIVTSTKRAKAQRDIPGSVAALRGEDLERMHAQGMKDYLKLVPGVSFLDQGDESSVPIIRGIATDISFGATPLTTGVYLDDMPFADLFGSGAGSLPDLNPFDLERVEVLKGPQGTLFGSGALAGAIRYIVEKPKLGLWEAKISGNAQRVGESHGIWPTGAAAVNVPIGDTLAIRAVGVYRKDRGVYDMSARNCTPDILPVSIPAPLITLFHQLPALPVETTIPTNVSSNQSCDGEIRNEPDADRLSQWTARVLAAWSPAERFHASAFYFDQKTRIDDYGYARHTDFLGSEQFPFASPSQREFGGGNLLLTYDFDWAQLLSSTNRMTKHNYGANHQEWFFSLGDQNQNEYLAAFRYDVRGWTQELRLSSPEGGSGMFEWLIGASYLHYGSAEMQYSYIGPDKPDPQNRDDVSATDKLIAQVYSTSDEVASEKALFGEITLRAGEHWEFTAGARRYQTALTGTGTVCGAQILALFPNSAQNGGCQPDTFEDKANGLNPKFSIRYVHNKHLQWYALVAKGFQFGGIQINPPAPGFEQSTEDAGYHFGPFKSSRLWNYETGVRTEWWHRRLRFDVGVFYLDWKDLQQTVRVDLLGSGVPFNVIVNIGRAHSVGVESSLEALPFAGFKWVTTMAIMNAVTDIPLAIDACGAAPCAAGTRLPGTPKFQIANVASYEWRTPFWGLSLGPTLTHSYTGSSPDYLPATGTVGGYSTLDAQLVFAKRDTRLVPELSIGVNNIADTRGVTYHIHFDTPLPPNAPVPIDLYHFIQPRTLVANFSMRFGG